MPPKLNKLEPSKGMSSAGNSLDNSLKHKSLSGTPPKVNPLDGLDKLQKDVPSLSNSNGPDPFAPKKKLLGAISPNKNVEPTVVETEDDQSNKNNENEVDNQVNDRMEEDLRTGKEEKSDGGKLDKMEEDNKDIDANVNNESIIPNVDDDNFPDKEEKEEEKKEDEEEDFDINENVKEAEPVQLEDEYLEATHLSAQEAKINQIMHMRGTSHMSAYEKPISAISLDIPFLRAVLKDDIDTIKMFLSEDFSDFCGDNNEDNFLSVRDNYGRTALHVAAAGSSSLMVEYLLTHSRVCMERVKHNEMKQLIEARKKCLMELKMSMKRSLDISGKTQKKSLNDSFSKNDYRVAAIEKWFEGEVCRINRKVELLIEAQWIRGILQRDEDGKTPLHYAAHTGSMEVLRALLCVPPFYSGRGIFSISNKQKMTNKMSGAGKSLKKDLVEKPFEWFKPGGVYNSLTGEEVAVMHKMETSSESKDFGLSKTKEKLTLHDVAQVSAFNSYISPVAHEGDDENCRSKMDYDILVPWLVRNIHKRSRDMSKKLGASAMEVLEEMVAMVNPDKGGRVLILPEIRELLRYLGIVVTTDVIKELCNIYPAPMDLVEEKYQNYRDNEEYMLLSDSKSFSSNFARGTKSSRKESYKQSYDLFGSDSKGEDDNSGDKNNVRFSSKESKTGEGKSEKGVSDYVEIDTKKKTLFDPNSEEATFGLAIDLLFDDIASGRGMNSIFSDTGTFGNEKMSMDNSSVVKNRGRIDAVTTFRLPDVVSIANIMEYRSMLLNCRDGAGNTALIVTAALGKYVSLHTLPIDFNAVPCLGKLQQMEELIGGGADITLETPDHHTALSVAKNQSIIGVLQREFVSQLKSRRDKMLAGCYESNLSSAKSLKLSKEFVDSLQVTNDDNILSKSTKGNSDDIVLQLHDLKSKRWAYSQSALTWAIESGNIDAVDNMLSQGIDTNEADISGRVPLHTCAYMASQCCDIESLVSLRKVTEAVLNSGGDINCCTVAGKTPLHEFFSKNKSIQTTKISPEEKALLIRLRALLVRSLLQWGADPLKTDRQGYTSLYYCAKENMTLCMIELLKVDDIDIYFQDQRGRTVLHTACIFGAEAVGTLLVNYDADYATGIQYVQDKDGKMAKNLLSPHMNGSCLITMWQACRLGNIGRVNAILEQERKRNSRLVYENVEEEQAPRNPLDVTSGQEDSKKDLWLHGGVDCKTRLHKWTPLHACIIGWAEYCAFRTKNKSTLKVLSYGNTTTKSASIIKSFRSTKSMFPVNLIESNFSTIISALVQNFAYIDSLDFKCRTPLMYAAAFNLPSAISLLCTAGADVNLRDLDGNTALHYAYACGSNAAASALEEKNIDANIENNDGKTALEVLGVMRTIAPFFKTTAFHTKHD